MDELIEVFLDNFFTEEFKDEVLRSFSLFEAFEYQTAYSSFIDLINEQSYASSDNLKDRFVKELQQKLDYILTQHMVALNPAATVYEKNEVLTALFRIQHLEDYTGVIRTLEGNESDEYQLAIILSELCALDETRLMTLIESCRREMLVKLKEFIYAKEKNQPIVEEVDKDLIRHLKLFFATLGRVHTAADLVESGVLTGAPFETYLPFVENVLIVQNNPAQTALNILSIIYLSENGYKNPIEVYRQYSFQLLKDLNTVSRLEVTVWALIKKLEEAKKVEDEKARLSASSNQT